jgi:alkylated DNA nucleotide flippase Atl1
VRAVGSAVGKNPFPPQVPCHRLVPTDGPIRRYSGGEGVVTKIALLAKEGVKVKSGKIVDFSKRFYRFPEEPENGHVSR